MLFKKKALKKDNSIKPSIHDIPVKVESQLSTKGKEQVTVSGKSYKTLAITSGKGGVGKSTITANLAIALKEMGLVVGVLDADIYGPCQSGLFGALGTDLETNQSGEIMPMFSQGVHFVSSAALVKSNQAVLWRAPMVNKLIMQFLYKVSWPKALDILLLDLPPGTGDIHITLCQKANIDGAIVVSTPQHVATQVAERGLQMLNKVNVPIWGLIENMSGLICKSCGTQNEIFMSGASDKLAKHYDIPVIAKIPLEMTLCESSESGRPILNFSPESQSAESFRNIAKFVNKKIKDNTSLQKINCQLKDGDLLINETGKQKQLSAKMLRAVCQCASCVDENTGNQLLNTNSIADDISIIKFKMVGNYGLQLFFSDGHHTGIYQFSKLEKL